MSSIETFERPTYDILPVPKGSWKADYDKKNSEGNMILAIGVVAFTATVLHSSYDPMPQVTKEDFPIDPRTI